MNHRILTLVALGLSLAWVLACSGMGGSTEPPPPPPPPPTPAPVPTPAPEVTPPPAPAPKLLPSPWGELGLASGDGVVALVKPEAVILTWPGAAGNGPAEAVYADWGRALAAAGFVAAPTWNQAEDGGANWNKGEARLGAAHGAVDGEAYVYIEDQTRVSVAAVDRHTPDKAVHDLLAPPDAHAQKGETSAEARTIAALRADKSSGEKSAPEEEATTVKSAAKSGSEHQGHGVDASSSGTKTSTGKGGKKGGKKGNKNHGAN